MIDEKFPDGGFSIYYNSNQRRTIFMPTHTFRIKKWRIVYSLNIIDLFIHKRLKHTQLDEARQTRTVVGMVLAMIVCVFAFSILYYVQGSIGAALWLLSGLPFGVLVLTALRSAKKVRVVAYAGYVVFLIMIIGCSIHLGGFNSPTLMWIVVSPMLVLFITGKSAGKIWMLISVAVLVGYYFIHRSGVCFDQDLDQSGRDMIRIFNLIGLLFLLFIFTYIFEYSQKQYQYQIERGKEELMMIRKAIDASSDAVSITDKNGRIFFQNETFQKTFGYSNIKQLNQYGLSLLFTDVEKARDVFSATQNGNSWKGEVEMVSHDGKKFPALISTDAVKDEFNKIVALVGIFRDITHRKEVENELLKNEEKYRMLAENVTDVIWIRDLDLNLIYVSQGIERTRGFTQNEFMKLPLEKYITPESLKLVQETYKRKLQDEAEDLSRGIIFEIEQYRKDGSTGWFEISSRFIRDDKDVPVAIIGVSRDISERKETEAKLHVARAELIENAHRAGMADVAAGTLHNVGNLLNSIKTSAHSAENVIINSSLSDLKKANEMLKDKLGNIEDFIKNDPNGIKLLHYYLYLESELDLEQKDIHNDIHRINEKIDTITDVIASQQNYAGFGSLVELYSLEKLVNDVLTIETELIDGSKITVYKDFKELPKILIQKSKLLHILLNLIKNSSEAMVGIPEENRKLHISTEKRGGNVYLKVTDNGIGIVENDLTKIFSHGFTTKTDGHGFGLHTSAIYMSDMKGKIWVESEGRNKGATFVLQFPVSETEEAGLG